MNNQEKKQFRDNVDKTIGDIAAQLADDTEQHKPIGTERDMAIIMACCAVARTEGPEPTDSAVIENGRARQFLLDLRNISQTLDKEPKLRLLGAVQDLVEDFELPELARAVAVEVEGAERMGSPSPLAEEDGVKEELRQDQADHLSLEGKAGVSATEENIKEGKQADGSPLPKIGEVEKGEEFPEELDASIDKCEYSSSTGPCILAKGHGGKHWSDFDAESEIDEDD